MTFELHRIVQHPPNDNEVCRLHPVDDEVMGAMYDTILGSRSLTAQP